LILDEDGEGIITLEEFQHALQAYGHNVEKHYAPDGSDYAVPFEQVAMFKLLKTLKDRSITYDELFRMCDTNDDT
jgi:hypothetical protein